MDTTFLTAVAQNPLDLQNVLFNLSVAVGLGLVLQYHFRRFASVFTSKEEMGRILPFLVLIVCLIISIVKSSLALSLGLVGALSIVRFRTAIKDPEELVYLFMAIAIGLGLGANQTALTVAASLLILAFVAALRWRKLKNVTRTAYLHVASNEPLDKRTVSEAIKTNVVACELKKVVDGSRSLLIYNVKVSDETALYKVLDAVRDAAPLAEVSFVDKSEALDA